MKILSLTIKEGVFEKTFNFSKGVNLICSKQNSRGKTTLLRCLLYALGYSVPSTRGFFFDKCDIQIYLDVENYGVVSFIRNNKNSITAEVLNETRTFILPEEQVELHSFVFKTNNSSLIDNILGTFYIDQEKGWTLLNRGVVIGGIRFNIEDLIRGLSGKGCEKLLEQQQNLKSKLIKYKNIFSIALYRNSVIESTGDLCLPQYEEQSQTKLNQLLVQQQLLKKELTRIDKTIKGNKNFKSFIAGIKLLVKGSNGEEIPVTEDNIIGLTDSIELLLAKKKLVIRDLADLSQQIASLQSEKHEEQQQLEFFSSEKLIDFFDRKIASIPINSNAIREEIKKTEQDLAQIKHQISIETKKDNSIAESMYNNIVRYATELGVGDSESIAKNYLYTSNLKELSGAVLHKTVFAFKLAYIIEVEKVLGIKLPIILDSPSGKEVDPENIQLMINILKRDFADNQIIIASIFEYNFDHPTVIRLYNRLMEP